MIRREIVFLILTTAASIIAVASYTLAFHSWAALWLSLNILAAIDKALGVVTIVSPALSWGIVGLLTGALCYFAIWETRNLGKRKKRYQYLMLAGLILFASPILWASRSIVLQTGLLPPAEPQAGDTRTFGSIEFVWIPAGDFSMGSPAKEDGRSINEKLHAVTLSHGYWMGKYEITRAQWKAALGYLPPSLSVGEETDPVTNISFYDCHAYLQKLGSFTGQEFRIPTEAEWEYACRAGSKSAYSFGDDPSKLGDYEWCEKNSDDHTHPVGTKTPNAWGLYDMQGNAAEWCEDWYAEYPSDSVVDPAGPPLGRNKVFRGGFYGNSPEGCRSATRYQCESADENQSLGLRICCSTPAR